MKRIFYYLCKHYRKHPRMATDKKVILALGSNINQEANMRQAENLLCQLFGKNIIFTDTIWTLPIGIKSDKFLNCLAVFHVSQEMKSLDDALKKIECQLGSDKLQKQIGIVPIDIDILKFGDIVCHMEDWKRSYIRQLLERI